MKTIWKYELDIDNEVEISLPKHSKILSVQTQEGKPVLWAEVNTDNQLEKRFFNIFGTGYKIDDKLPMGGKYIGTFQMREGILVFHLYERFTDIRQVLREMV